MKINRLKNQQINTNDLETMLPQCTEAERRALFYLYENMPLSDATDYHISLYVDYVQNSLSLFEEIDYCQRIPKDIFNQYVLFHRVNDEELSACRKYFRDILSPRILNKTMLETAQEVNIWCGENVTYRFSDKPTNSALTVYKNGYGRCGEQSMFAVQVLRSVGIPARQLYVPWWSHCDDNHAWVEYWCDGEWYFFGGGEPLPTINNGWFVRAASRALIVQTPWFGILPPQNDFGEIIRTVDNVFYINRISRYGVTKRLKIRVKDALGKPIENVYIELKVINYAKCSTIVSFHTDVNGTVCTEIGKGSMIAVASKDGVFKEVLIESDTENVEIVFHDCSFLENDFIFYPPAESDKNILVLTDAEKKETMQLKAMVRKKYLERLCEDSYKPLEHEIRNPLASAQQNVFLTTTKPVNIWKYGHNWSVDFKSPAGFESFKDTKDNWSDGKLALHLPVGDYRIITTNRLPNCNLCCRMFYFNVYENKSTTVEISLYKVPLNEMLSDLDILDFTLVEVNYNNSPKHEFSKSMLTKNRGGVFIWLQPGEEPTEHILNEIYDNKDNYLSYKEMIHLIVNDGQSVNNTLMRVIDELGIRIYTEKEPYNEILARRVFCEPESYPFVMILNEKGNCLCAKNGYYVGYSDLILMILNR